MLFRLHIAFDEIFHINITVLVLYIPFVLRQMLIGSTPIYNCYRRNEVSCDRTVNSIKYIVLSCPTFGVSSNCVCFVLRPPM